LSEFVDVDQLKVIREQTSFRQQGKMTTYELTIKRPDGQKRELLVTATPQSNYFGDTVGTFGVFRDISERKQHEKELEKAKIKAEESDQLKSVFLANVSHEIRTPMNGIKGFAEMLKKPDISEDKKRTYIDIICKCSDQLMILISDLVDISKIESKQMQLISQDTNLNALMEDILTFFEPLANEKKIELLFKKDVSNDNLTVVIDSMKLRQILSNLISNSIKFTHKGQVEFNYSIQQNEILFTIHDTGIGIPSEYHDTIFESFKQVEKDFTKMFGGIGLGLSITKALIELMGGNIWLDSEQGKGSSFYFTLPYQQKIVSLKKENIQLMNNEYDFSGKVILVAEDIEANYQIIQECLSETKAMILRAENGKQAVEIAFKSMVDIILMDWKMPEMDGTEATRRIKEKLAVPIIMVTAYASKYDKEMAIKVGCDSFVEKPIDQETLLATIASLLLKKQ